MTSLHRRESVFNDIFDEMEHMSSNDRCIRNLSTDMVLASYRHTLSCRAYEGANSSKECQHHIEESSSVGNSSPTQPDVISIYHILTDSFKSKFSSKYAHILEKLKSVPVMKSGLNKRSGQMETYVWRSPGSCRTFEDGGRLGPLRDDKSGRHSNWHSPFFGGLVVDKPEDRRETRRLACLLCENLTTVQNLRQNQIKHMISHHRECAEVFLSSTGGIDTKQNAADMQWLIAIKQAQLCFVEFMPFKTVCSEAMTIFAKTLNPGYMPFDAQKLRHALLYNIYAPSLHHVSDALHRQLLCLPSSLSLTLDRWTKPALGSVYGCSLSFIDDEFILHSFVLGLTPLAEGIDIVPYAIAKILAAIGPIMCADCYAMISRETDDTRIIASNLGLPMVGLSVDDVLIMLRTVISQRNPSGEEGGGAGPDSAAHQQRRVLDIPTAIARAQSVVNYFLTSEEAMEVLCVIANNTVHINLEQFSNEDPSSLHSCLSSLVQASVPITTYFTGMSSEQADGVVGVYVPSSMDWKFWCELMAVLDPVRTVIEMLRGKNDPGISLLWYVLDWLVCIYEQTTEWEVLSVQDGQKHSVTTMTMCEGVRDWVSSFFQLVQCEFLSLKLKTLNSGKYSLMCKATFVDPRTKNFKFFRSESCQLLLPDMSCTFPDICKTDAKAMILQDMQEELCALIQDVFLGNLHPEDRLFGLVHNIVSSAGVAVPVATTPYPGPQRHTRRAVFDNGKKRKVDRGNGGDSFSTAEPSPPSSAEMVTAALNTKVDMYCRFEMKIYEDAEMICLPHQIRQHDALAYWAQNAFKFPILSQLARRLLCLKNVSVSERVCSVSSRLHRRRRLMVPLALADAITFLHLNGVIQSTTPEL